MTAALEPKYNCLLKWYLMKIRGHVEGHLELYCEEASNCLLLMSFASFKWLKQGRLWNCAFINRLNCVMQTVQMCDYPGSLSGRSRIVCHLLRVAHKILAFVLFTLWKKMNRMLYQIGECKIRLERFCLVLRERWRRVRLVRQGCALLVVYKGDMSIEDLITSCRLQRWNGNRSC